MHVVELINGSSYHDLILLAEENRLVHVNGSSKRSCVTQGLSHLLSYTLNKEEREISNNTHF